MKRATLLVLLALAGCGQVAQYHGTVRLIQKDRYICHSETKKRSEGIPAAYVLWFQNSSNRDKFCILVNATVFDNSKLGSEYPEAAPFIANEKHRVWPLVGVHFPESED